MLDVRAQSAQNGAEVFVVENSNFPEELVCKNEIKVRELHTFNDFFNIFIFCK